MKDLIKEVLLMIKNRDLTPKEAIDLISEIITLLQTK